MKTHYIFILLLLPGLSGIDAQPYDYTKIDTLLAPWCGNTDPGFTVGILNHQKLEYAKGFGLANLSDDIPNTPHTVFRIASTSKQFTAACIYLCARQGLLSLDDPISKFFPDFPAYAKNIEIKHLIHHSSGLRDYLVLSYLAGMRDEDFYTDEEIMDWLKRQKALNFEPGSEYLYSNSGYWMLGQIVQKASGKSLAEYARENIFIPLGMEQSQFVDDPRQVIKNLAIGYTPLEDENGFRIDMTTLPMVGDGGVHTSISDMARWEREMIYHKTFGDAFWKEMTGVGFLNNGDSTDYAGGLSIESYHGLKTISHGGAFVGYLSYLLVFPDKDLAITILANRNDIEPWDMTYKIADRLLDLSDDQTAENDTIHPTFKSLSPKQMEPFIGNYKLDEGVNVAITINEDSIHVNQLWNGIQYNLAPIADNRFVIPSSPNIIFEFSEVKDDGNTHQLVVDQNGRKTVAQRQEESPQADIKRVLSDYTGKFFSDELQINYIIEARQDSLFLKIKNNKPLYLNPSLSDKDIFIASGLTVRFTRAQNKVNGLLINAGRVKGISFKRVDKNEEAVH